MEQGSMSLFRIAIDFQQSHLFFPKIVMWTMVLLLAMVFLVYGVPFLKSLHRGERKLAFSAKHVDKLRLFGTIALTVLYFFAMDFVGDLFPNRGFGFLFVSMPFMFVLSLLYVHGLDRKKLIAILLNALISPSLAWYVLAKLFNITLP